jgi:hypothetical protein
MPAFIRFSGVPLTFRRPAVLAVALALSCGALTAAVGPHRGGVRQCGPVSAS